LNTIGSCIKTIQGINVYRRIAGLFSRGVTIREASEEDKRKVSTWLHAGRVASTNSPDIAFTYFVAEKGGRILGSVELVRRSKKFYPYDGHWLVDLNVRVAHRGMGIGEMLSKKVIARSVEEGSKELSLTVREDNHRAIALYRKIGFQIKVIPEIEKQFEQERRDRGSSMILMCIS
jgi:ribosomal protein S18 acetylase RimI-like enzyme